MDVRNKHHKLIAGPTLVKLYPDSSPQKQHYLKPVLLNCDLLQAYTSLPACSRFRARHLLYTISIFYLFILVKHIPQASLPSPPYSELKAIVRQIGSSLRM